MLNLLLVACGGAIGASARHLLSHLAQRAAFGNFPWWTAAINISGSLLMGLLIGFLANRTGMGGTSNSLRIFLATGVLGGYTTFSAFSLDFAVLWERGEVISAFAYVLGSVLLSLLAIFAGLWVARAFS